MIECLVNSLNKSEATFLRPSRELEDVLISFDVRPMQNEKVIIDNVQYRIVDVIHSPGYIVKLNVIRTQIAV